MSNDDASQPVNKEEVSHQIERYKALLDYSKQLTTLSTGSIVLVAAFLEKVFPVAHWKVLTAFSLVGFMVSIVGAIAAHTFFILDFPPRKTKGADWEDLLGGVGLFSAWGGFLVGILSLAIFAIKNLLQ